MIALDVYRWVNVVSSFVAAVFMLRLTWRLRLLPAFDYYGNPRQTSMNQIICRYGFVLLLAYSGYGSLNNLARHRHGDTTAAILTALTVGIAVAAIGWHRETYPRPFFRPLWARIRRHPAGPPNS